MHIYIHTYVHVLTYTYEHTFVHAHTSKPHEHTHCSTTRSHLWSTLTFLPPFSSTANFVVLEPFPSTDLPFRFSPSLASRAERPHSRRQSIELLLPVSPHRSGGTSEYGFSSTFVHLPQRGEQILRPSLELHGRDWKGNFSFPFVSKKLFH